MLNLPARITYSDANVLARNLTGQISAQPNAVVLDGQQLVEFDSSALAVLLACRRSALAAGKQFSVDSLPAKLEQLAALYGVAQLMMPPIATELP